MSPNSSRELCTDWTKVETNAVSILEKGNKIPYTVFSRYWFYVCSDSGASTILCMYGMQVNSQPLPTTDLEKDDRLEREEAFFMETYSVTQIRSEERQLVQKTTREVRHQPVLTLQWAKPKIYLLHSSATKSVVWGTSTLNTQSELSRPTFPVSAKVFSWMLPNTILHGYSTVTC